MKTEMKAIFGITHHGKDPKWMQIGVAFVNRDGSLNLKFDFLPTDLANTTIQVRDIKRSSRLETSKDFSDDEVTLS